VPAQVDADYHVPFVLVEIGDGPVAEDAALFTTTSSRPNSLTAVFTKSSACAQSAMACVLAMAVPPARVISSATSDAGP
jgi:hypothetical protein